MKNIKLRVLRGLLEECINDIDAGNSNHSEEAAYLTGYIGQLMFPKAKRFLCKCHCE